LHAKISSHHNFFDNTWVFKKKLVSSFGLFNNFVSTKKAQIIELI